LEQLERRDVPSAYSVVDLGTLGGNNSYASAINATGQVVGQAQVAGGAAHAFLWDNGTMTDLGLPDGSNSSAASGINASGQVVGRGVFSQGEAGTSTAFLWDDGVFTNIASNGTASGINDQGQVVGQSQLGRLGSPSHAFLYDGGLTDLG